LQNGMTSRDLARCIQIAIRGFNNLRLDAKRPRNSTGSFVCS